MPANRVKCWEDLPVNDAAFNLATEYELSKINKIIDNLLLILVSLC